ncbi:uncharacterized protein LOC124280042 [Haliotis rubra]|uniref:uncharacterized protein LOC124280042 n=1 Tax=Haliotis rubra TaxID=36100 RepID=UPI001EE597FF|nr:uncharacterized protein LOC124280042 [Haliotis rubra]
MLAKNKMLLNVLLLLLAIQNLHVMTLKTQGSSDDDIGELIFSYEIKYCESRCSATTRNDAMSPFPANDSVCPRCFCDKKCGDFGDCCPDLKFGKEEYKLECVELSQGFSEAMRIYVVTRCSLGDEQYSEELAWKCNTSKENVPVSIRRENSTSLTFRNKYCAQCHGFEHFQTWDIGIACDQFPEEISNISEPANIYEWLQTSDVCKIEYLVPTNISTRMCSEISECNVTGHWGLKNDSIEAACLAYSHVTSWGYQNIFCHICNEGYITEPCCLQPGIRTMRVKSLTGLLQFEEEHLDLPPVENKCLGGEYHDRLTDRCHKILCPPFQHLKNRECKDIFAPFVRMSEYFIDIFLVPIVTKTFKTANLTQITRVLADYYISKILGNDTATEKVVVTVNIKNSSDADPVLNKGDNYNEINASDISSIDVRLYFAVNFTTADSFAVFAERLSNLLFGDASHSDEAMNISLRALYKDMLPDLQRSTNYTSVYEPDEIDEDTFRAFPRRYITRKCPHVLYPQSDYTLDSTNALLRNSSSPIPEVNFTLTEDLGILVCLSTLEDLQFEVRNDSEGIANADLEQSYDILTILTTVCLSVSMFFLAVSFLVYITLAPLRTLPGCLLMSLMVSLFFAQGLFLFGAGAHDNTVVCQIMGVLIHYFWMASFAWMGVNTFHVFRVFRNILSSVNLSGNKRKIFFKYVAFAHLTPAVIVAVTILTNYFMSGKSTIGYSDSGEICFLNPGIVSLVAFGAPIFTTVVFTIVFFVSSMTAFRRLSKDRVQAGKKEQGTLLHMLKLASISGMSWLFSLFEYLFKIKAFSYVFVILAGGQGLLIFLSFVFKLRVLKLCMKGGTRSVSSSSKRVTSRVTSSSNVSSGTSPRA